MNIHIHSLLFNEQDLLPHFINHYSRFVNKFFFYDNNSSDNSIDIISKSGIDYEIIKFDSAGLMNEYQLTEIRNTGWKKSKNCGVDYVIVCDIDEFLYTPDIYVFLQRKKNAGVTVFKPEGYNMYSETFPEIGKNIIDQVKSGLKYEDFDKCVIFSPDDVDLVYGPGSHACSTTGQVNMCKYDGLKLLHYKYLSLDYLLFKMRRSRNRLPAEHFKVINVHYSKSDDEITQKFLRELNLSTKVI